MRTIFFICFICTSTTMFAQDDLLSMVEKEENKKEYISSAFKSSRVVNGHSMEFIGKGVLDVRILHRFGTINSGVDNLYGLDQAAFRLGFDYGLGKSLTIGMGRSTTLGKDLDGFIKYRPIWQAKGGKGASPVSVVLVTGMTYATAPWTDTSRENFTSSRMAYYSEIIIGRKFNEWVSLQLTPTFVHRNLVELASEANDVFALGVGGRIKITHRTAFVIDYSYVFSGLDKTVYKDPLSLGFDIETGGHVFQLHFSNALGMNEKTFLTKTTNSWGKGEIRFGFNLSRVFTVYRGK